MSRVTVYGRVELHCQLQISNLLLHGSLYPSLLKTMILSLQHRLSEQKQNPLCVDFIGLIIKEAVFPLAYY